MTRKQTKKLKKRAHIASARMVQDAWIAKAGLPKPITRRERDRRFNASR